MVRRALSARISADLELREIVIRLDPVKEPVVMLRGSIRAADRRASASSAVEITTQHLTDEAEAMIESAKRTFATEKTG